MEQKLPEAYRKAARKEEKNIQEKKVHNDGLHSETIQTLQGKIIIKQRIR